MILDKQIHIVISQQEKQALAILRVARPGGTLMRPGELAHLLLREKLSEELKKANAVVPLQLNQREGLSITIVSRTIGGGLE